MFGKPTTTADDVRRKIQDEIKRVIETGGGGPRGVAGASLAGVGNVSWPRVGLLVLAVIGVSLLVRRSYT